MKALIRENKELQTTLTSIEERLGHFTNIEETLSKTIIVAQNAADEVKTNAKKESQLIVREAEKNADRIINESLAKVPSSCHGDGRAEEAIDDLSYTFPFIIGSADRDSQG